MYSCAAHGYPCIVVGVVGLCKGSSHCDPYIVGIVSKSICIFIYLMSIHILQIAPFAILHSFVWVHGMVEFGYPSAEIGCGHVCNLHCACSM